MTDPKQPDPKDPTAPSTPWSLLKLFIASVFIGAMQGGLSSYAAMVDWTKGPNWETYRQVLHSLESSMAIGAIRGTLIGFMVVAIVLLGGPLWAILGPFLAAAERQIANFVSAFRAKKDDDKGAK